jgi:hypothetical protein
MEILLHQQHVNIAIYAVCHTSVLQSNLFVTFLNREARIKGQD